MNISFTSMEEVDNLDLAQALAIAKMARDRLVEITADEPVAAVDDLGDYMYAAVENYYRLFSAYQQADGDPNFFIPLVREFLREPIIEWGGCDGEIRCDILPFVDYDDEEV